MKLPRGVRELSLKPYPGRLFMASSRAAYEAASKKLLMTDDKLNPGISGRFLVGPGRDGMTTILIWAENSAYLAHELSHAILYTFDLCGIDPRQAGGEPFCYLLSQLLLDAGVK